MPHKTSVFNRTAIFHFCWLPVTVRLFYSAALIVLGLGYVFAMLQIQIVHSGQDGKPGLSIDDLIIAYKGSSDKTQLETKLYGSMSGMLPGSERDKIIAWIEGGASQKGYEETVAPITQQYCKGCHNGATPGLPDLMGFEKISTYVKIDSGMSLATLIRVSHIHMFGILFVFFIMGIIFFHAYVRPIWLKALILVTPFAAVILDIFSWYLTKVHPGFAWVIVISGGFMALCFAAMWFISFYQMWFYKPSRELIKNHGAAL